MKGKNKTTGELIGLVIFIVLSVLYSYVLTGNFNGSYILDVINLAVNCIFISSIIIIMETNEKYINSIYKYLSIGVTSIGVLNTSFILMNKTLGAIGGDTITSRMYYIVSFFEAIIHLGTYIAYKKNISIKKFGLLCLTLLFSCGYLSINPQFKWLLNLEGMGATYEKIIVNIIILIIFGFLFINLIKDRKCFEKKIFIYFNIACISRVIIEIYNIFNINNLRYNHNIVIHFMFLLFNYSLCRIIICKIINNPNKDLYNGLVNKSECLEWVLMDLRRKCAEEEIKNELLSNISHEFKTPVNVIYSAIQMQEFNKEKENVEDILKYNPMIKQNCFRLMRLINNFIDTCKLKDKDFDVELKCENIVEVVEITCMSVLSFAECKGLTLIFDTTEEELYGDIDRDMFERVVLNIISNSIKYNKEDGKINVDIYSVDDNIAIEISDTGIGIETEKLEVIFNRFERVDKNLSRHKEGTGLGLNIAKEIIKIHNGEITVESKVNEGTIFKIVIPRSKVGVSQKKKCDGTEEQLNEAIRYKVDLEFSDIY